MTKPYQTLAIMSSPHLHALPGFDEMSEEDQGTLKCANSIWDTGPLANYTSQVWEAK
jgi:hypothetical protein